MKSANPKIAVSWAHLPPDLVVEISKRLPSKIDLRRFRAVCSSWRSSAPPYRFPTIKLPFPFDQTQENPDPKHSGAYFTLIERVVYRIQLPDSKDPDFWLVKIEFDDHGNAKILNPVTHRKIQIPPEFEGPKVFNILDFDVSEVCRAYALRYVNPSTPDEIDDYYDYRHASKVVYSANEGNGEYAVMTIDRKFNLWHIKSDGEMWNRMLPHDAFYDVGIVEGEFRAADLDGRFWAFDSQSRVPPIPCNSLRRHMVELYNGESALVEVMPHCLYDIRDIKYFRVSKLVVSVLVLTLSEHLMNWDISDAEAMYGCIIVVGDDCSFSIPTTQQHKGVRLFYMNRYKFVNNGVLYTGFECDCTDICKCYHGMDTIAYDDLVVSDDVKHLFKGFYGRNFGVFDSETCNSGTALVFPEYASIFWPPILATPSLAQP